MAENTAISWADDTFNPWIGCTKVSPACDGCYAEALMDTRLGRVTWGPHGERVRTSPANWAKPLTWEREQARSWDEFRMCFEGEAPGVRAPAPRFVFCASLADVFDNQVQPEWRRDLFDLIRRTPHLTWLLLTKRPQNIIKLYDQAENMKLAQVGGTPHPWPRNAAIGCTVVTQAEADRDIPVLLAAKAALNPAFAFISMEPLLGLVDISRWLDPTGISCLDFCDDAPYVLPSEISYVEVGNNEVRPLCPSCGELAHATGTDPGLDWVITGGETDQGKHTARPSHTDWFRSIRDQCAEAGVAYHHKQNGEWAPRDDEDGGPIPVFRVGKKAAGRALDGVAHDARPSVGAP